MINKSIETIEGYVDMIISSCENMETIAHCNLIKTELNKLKIGEYGKEYDTDFQYLESYYRKGGTYELPTEIVNDLTGRIEELVAEVRETNVSLNWWKDRYNADEKILERYRTDENGSNTKTSTNNN